jgi:hypothetical protein
MSISIFLCYLLHTSHRDKFQHIFSWYCQQMFTECSCKHIVLCNCQRSNLDCLDIQKHNFLKSYLPMSLALWDIHSHKPMLSCQRKYLESKGIYQGHSFLSYCQPNCLADIGQNILLCLKLQKEQELKDTHLHNILLSNLRSSLLDIVFDRFWKRCRQTYLD